MDKIKEETMRYIYTEDREFKVIKDIENARIVTCREGYGRKTYIVNKVTLAETEISTKTWFIIGKYIIFSDKIGIGIFDCISCTIKHRKIEGIIGLKVVNGNIAVVDIENKGQMLYALYTSANEIRRLV